MSLRSCQPLISRWARKQRAPAIKPYTKHGANIKKNNQVAGSKSIVNGSNTTMSFKSVNMHRTNNMAKVPIAPSKEAKSFSIHLMEVTDVDSRDKGKTELVPVVDKCPGEQNSEGILVHLHRGGEKCRGKR